MDQAANKQITALDSEHRGFLAAIVAANDDLTARAQRLGVLSFYDREDDVLVITIGDPTEAITESVNNTFFLRVDPDTLKLVGIEVFGVKALIASQPEFLDLFADATGVPGPSVTDSPGSPSVDATGRLVHIVRDLVSI